MLARCCPDLAACNDAEQARPGEGACWAVSDELPEGCEGLDDDNSSSRSSIGGMDTGGDGGDGDGGGSSSFGARGEPQQQHAAAAVGALPGALTAARGVVVVGSSFAPASNTSPAFPCRWPPAGAPGGSAARRGSSARRQPTTVQQMQHSSTGDAAAAAAAARAAACATRRPATVTLQLPAGHGALSAARGRACTPGAPAARARPATAAAACSGRPASPSRPWVVDVNALVEGFLAPPAARLRFPPYRCCKCHRGPWLLPCAVSNRPWSTLAWHARLLLPPPHATLSVPRALPRLRSVLTAAAGAAGVFAARQALCRRRCCLPVLQRPRARRRPRSCRRRQRRR